MIKTVLLFLALLLALPVGLVLLVVLPLLLVGVLLKAVLFVIILPFRILGMAIGLAATAMVLVLKGLLIALALIVGLGAVTGGFLLFLGLPLLLVALAIWVLSRLLAPSSLAGSPV